MRSTPSLRGSSATARPNNIMGLGSRLLAVATIIAFSAVGGLSSTPASAAVAVGYLNSTSLPDFSRCYLREAFYVILK